MARNQRTPSQHQRDTRHQKARSSSWYSGCDQVSGNQRKKIAHLTNLYQMEQKANSAPPPPGEEGPVPAFYSSVEWKQLRLAVKLRDKGSCRYCGVTAQTADHVIPRKKGGPDTLDNLVACCHDCNNAVRGRSFLSFDDKRDWILWARQQDLSA